VKDEGSRILRSDNRTREDKYRRREDKGVLDWPNPKGVKDMQKFLGLVNYCHRFIKNFVAIARLLHNMVKKNQKWK